MKYLTEFRNGEIAQRMAREIQSITTRPWKIMEICGGQTHSIIRNGIDQMLPEGVEMIHGDSGGILFIGTEGKILVNRGKFEATPAALGEEPLGDKAIRLYKSYSHTKDFLDCMRSRKKPICDVEIGCRSVTVCHLGNLAYWNHRHLHWDPVKERFVGDEEANQWLDRPKRAPWQV